MNSPKFLISQATPILTAGTVQLLAQTLTTDVIFDMNAVTSSGGAMSITLYEDTVISATGATTLASSSRNRNSDEVADMVVYDAPTITTLGTLVYTTLSTDVKDSEILLKKDTNYTYVIENLSGADVNVAINLEWKEISSF